MKYSYGGLTVGRNDNLTFINHCSGLPYHFTQLYNLIEFKLINLIERTFERLYDSFVNNYISNRSY